MKLKAWALILDDSNKPLESRTTYLESDDLIKIKGKKNLPYLDLQELLFNRMSWYKSWHDDWKAKNYHHLYYKKLNDSIANDLIKEKLELGYV